MTFRTFEDMKVWQDARVLVCEIRQLCSNRTFRDRIWIDQITRAALSVMANIAEGNDALTNAEFINFLGFAKRSAAEVRSHLYFALDEHYIDQEYFQKLCTQTKGIGAQLAGLIQYLRKHRHTLHNKS